MSLSCAHCGTALQLTFNFTEAGKLIGFSRWTIQKMVRRGELRVIPSGRKLKRIALMEIERWIRENQVYCSELRSKLDGRTVFARQLRGEGRA